jgi:DnaJ family protein B protein 12
MVVNREEALRCLSIAQEAISAGNFTRAEKFVRKSISLHETEQAQRLLVVIESQVNESTSTASSNPAAESDLRQRGGSAKAKSTSKPVLDEPEQRNYTPDQLEAVRRVKKQKVTDYYGILGVAKEASDSEIKKAYRKVRNRAVVLFALNLKIPVCFPYSYNGTNKYVLRSICSLHYYCTQTKIQRQGPMKHSKKFPRHSASCRIATNELNMMS